MPFGLIFDVDGLMVDTEPIIAQATIKMFRDLYGAELEPADFLPYVGAGALRYVEGPAEDAGLQIDLAKAVEIRHQNFVSLLEQHDSAAFPGVHELIAAAQASPEWKLAIATSSTQEKSAPTLRAGRIDPSLFSAWITGDNVVKKKPDPEIYLVAAEAIALEAARCVAIEDSIAGVSSAKAAGMQCIAVTNSFPTERLGEADLIVDSLLDVNLKTLETLVS